MLIQALVTFQLIVRYGTRVIIRKGDPSFTELPKSALASTEGICPTFN